MTTTWTECRQFGLFWSKIGPFWSTNRVLLIFLSPVSELSSKITPCTECGYQQIGSTNRVLIFRQQIEFFFDFSHLYQSRYQTPPPALNAGGTARKHRQRFWCLTCFVCCNALHWVAASCAIFALSYQCTLQCVAMWCRGAVIYNMLQHRRLFCTCPAVHCSAL